MGDHREQFEKNNHHFSEKKRSITFFKFFPLVPPMEFLFILWYPKGSKKNWPKCHSGQSVSGQSVTLAKVSLAKMSLWPKCHWPKCHQPKSHWPKCLSGQSVSGQSVLGQNVTLAKVSRPKCLWPKCDSAQKKGSTSLRGPLKFLNDNKLNPSWHEAGRIYPPYFGLDF